MATLRLPPGGRVTVVAQDPSLKPDQGLPTPQPPTTAPPPVDPGYGVDVGLGPVRPTHPIVIPPEVEVPPPTVPVDPNYGIDEGLGYLRPTHPIVIPPDKPAPEGPHWEIKTAWTPALGWVVVAVPVGAHPTPSKRK